MRLIKYLLFTSTFCFMLYLLQVNYDVKQRNLRYYNRIEVLYRDSLKMHNWYLNYLKDSKLTDDYKF